MSRKHTRRKHWPLVNPISYAISGVRQTPQDALDKLRLTELSAIESFATGRATHEDFRTLADMLNVAETLCESGIGGPDARAAIDAAEAALLAVYERHGRTGRLAFDGPGLQALRELHAWHDAQREAIDRSTFEKAIQKTHDCVRGAHPGMKVLV